MLCPSFSLRLHFGCVKEEQVPQPAGAPCVLSGAGNKLQHWIRQVPFGARQSCTPYMRKQRTEQALEPPVPAVPPWLEGNWLHSSGSVWALWPRLCFGLEHPSLSRLGSAWH